MVGYGLIITNIGKLPIFRVMGYKKKETHSSVGYVSFA